MPNACMLHLQCSQRCSDIHSSYDSLARGAQLFARNLTAGWTSWGNEVLRFQTLDRFVAHPPA